MIRNFVALSVMLPLMFFGAAGVVCAQNDLSVGAQIKRIELKKDLATPQYQLSQNQMQGRQRKWAGISTEYDTDALWTDELTFTYYVLVRGKSVGAPKESLFRGKVSYINIERGRGHKSDVYLHPSTLSRFGDIEKIAVLVEANGKLVAGDALPKTNQRWWEQYTPVDGMLLNRMQTPFAMIGFDDYEAVKPAAGQ